MTKARKTITKTIINEMIQATTRAGVFVRAIEHALVWLAPGAGVKWSARLKRLRFDLLIKTE